MWVGFVKIKARFFLLIPLCVFFLVACSTAEDSPVPITEGWHQSLKSPIVYRVKPGETLYSIAWNYGLDYRQIAAANKIGASYSIKAGQKLILGGSAKHLKSSPAAKKTSVAKNTVTKSAPVISAPAVVNDNDEATTDAEIETVTPQPATTHIIAVKKATVDGVCWAWPTRGRIICCYSATGLNKGIDITAKPGSPVTAAASGKVVYAGNGLRGYGNLIIIKHNDEYLSAYAHNRKLLVKEGQSVRIGQVIATMGNTEAKCVMVHFEIRKAGKPVNPNDYLPKC